MTNDELQQAIAANTAAIAQLTATAEQTNQALNMLVSEFIRPNAQQARNNYERLERVEGYMVSIAEQQQANAQQIAQNAEQIAANTQQIAALGDRLEQFDQRLEETRTLVAENGSRIAQLSVKQDQILDRVDEQQARTTESLNLLIEENRAFRESQQSQLAAIIGNGRRIDRLEQQAS